MNKQYIAISIPFLILNTGEISLIDTRAYSSDLTEYGKRHISGITCAISYYRETPQAARYNTQSPRHMQTSRLQTPQRAGRFFSRAYTSPARQKAKTAKK